MAPAETQKAPAAGLSDAVEAGRDGGAAALLQQRMQLSDAADGQHWCEGGRESVERERERGRKGGREGDSRLLPPPPFPHTRCL